MHNSLQRGVPGPALHDARLHNHLLLCPNHHCHPPLLKVREECRYKLIVNRLYKNNCINRKLEPDYWVWAQSFCLDLEFMSNRINNRFVLLIKTNWIRWTLGKSWQQTLTSVRFTLFWLSLNFFNYRIGLTLNRNKMQRCAGSCGGEQGTCEAERWGQLRQKLEHCEIARVLFSGPTYKGNVQLLEC